MISSVASRFALTALALSLATPALADEMTPLVGVWTGWSHAENGNKSLDNFVILRLDDDGAASDAEYLYPAYHVVCVSDLTFSSMFLKSAWSLDDSTLTAPTCLDGEVLLSGSPQNHVINYQWVLLSGVVEATGTLKRVSDDPDAPVHAPPIR